tara:strand:+ start:297 stop:470 length:174 start_codon:yes stop_codon:yes gene_type:complete
MEVEESFNDNHLICIELSQDDLDAILNKNSKYYGGSIIVEPPKSEEMLITIKINGTT